MKKLLIYFIVIIGFVSSCKPKSDQDILTAGNFKYWIVKRNDWKGRSKQIEYFDNTGKNLHFVGYENGGLAKYDGGDVILAEYWNMPKHNIFNYDGRNCQIIKLTDSIFIIKSDIIDTLIPAPENTIPPAYRKRQ